MPVIELVTRVRAPIGICFDAARNIDLHVSSTAKTAERAVAGVTSGLIGMGEDVTWEAVHLGFRQRLTSRITAFDRPRHFRDSQVQGAFRRFDHDHYFEEIDRDTTKVVDRFDYEAPFGWLGRLGDLLFLKRYMRRFLEERNRVLKEAAEDEYLRDR